MDSIKMLMLLRFAKVAFELQYKFAFSIVQVPRLAGPSASSSESSSLVSEQSALLERSLLKKRY